MTTMLLAIQFIIVIALIFIVLLQRTGISGTAGLSGGGHGVISGRAANNILTKSTIVLAIGFILNSLLIARIINQEHQTATSILKALEAHPTKVETLSAPKAE